MIFKILIVVKEIFDLSGKENKIEYAFLIVYIDILDSLYEFDIYSIKLYNDASHTCSETIKSLYNLTYF